MWFLTLEVLIFLICYFPILAYINVNHTWTPVFPLINPMNKSAHDTLGKCTAIALQQLKIWILAFPIKVKVLVMMMAAHTTVCQLPNPFQARSLAILDL